MTDKLLMIILQLTMICIVHDAYSQQKPDDQAILGRTPYFFQHDPKSADSLFLQDIQLLKHYGNFNGVDSELLKGPVLVALMQEQVKEGKAPTYKTLLDYIKDFKQTDAYIDFATGVLLYRKLAGMKVNPANWDNDKTLFVRMGFTVNDLDDFKAYILEPAHRQMTYKEAYVSYMKDFEALGK